MRLIPFAVALFSASFAFGQGATTSSMSGSVSSPAETLPGATVVAVHTPSGTTYGTSTNTEGRFSLRNLRVGGPYSVTVTFIGYQEKRYEGINLTLGENYVLNASLSEGVDLQAVDVTAFSNEQLNSDRTGAATKIGNDKILAMPTITRGFNDFTRLTPQANIKGDAISIAGANNRYNQVTIDGAVSNDVFGLASSGTNGGQTGTSPISLDAIEEFNVQIAPYDVRYGGFGGGAISAVTRSGTNEIQGSVYGYYRNQDLAGRTPGSLMANPEAERTRYEDFTDVQWGARLGGAIVKDKLFYFVSYEQTSNVTPLAFDPGINNDASQGVTAEEVALAAARARELGYDPGTGVGRLEATNESRKIFGRLDWNISDQHKLSFRHAYTKGEAVQINRTPTNLIFSNGGILRESTTNSSILDLSSSFGSNMSNNLIVGFTSVREPRSAPGEPFPRVNIALGGGRFIRMGTEAFSTVNNLEQDIFTLTDNFTIDKGRHTLTFGTHNELYSIYNAFIGQAFGDYQFSSMENWQNGIATSAVNQYSRTDNPREGAEFRAAQLGLYAQDEFQVTEKFKLTAGVRLDVPIYLDSPLENEDFNNSILGQELGQKNNDMPKPAFMFSPRVGFNWDVTGDRRTQVRGGTGIFTSRFPFVWVGGAFTQSGVLLDANQRFTPEGQDPNIPFVADPNNQPQRDPTAFTPGGRMTVIDQNFKLPQVWRTNIGVDQVLGDGWIATLDAMYSHSINAFRFTNINLTDPIGNLNGADDRVVYAQAPADRRRVSNYTEAVFVDNVNEGYSWNISAQLQKSWDFGLYGSVSYSYTRSTDLFPGTSSQNHSNYYRLASVNGSNNAEVGFNPFDARSRFNALLSYGKEYLNMGKTTVTLFYNGQTGAPFSYIVQGDVNRSTFSGNNNDHFSLIYVPRDASEITFRPITNNQGEVLQTPEQQWEAFNTFIENDSHLSGRRGEYAERNGARTPFTHQIDIKIMQDVFTNIGSNKNTLQISLDVFNLTNLFNKDWGRQFTYGNSFFDSNFRILRLAGISDDLVPEYTLNAIPNDEPWFTSDSPIGGSRWSAMIGLRYIFN